MDNFKGQNATGSYSFDMRAYTVLELFPYEHNGLDAEMKKTKTALYLKVRNNISGDKQIFYCSEVKMENL